MKRVVSTFITGVLLGMCGMVSGEEVNRVAEIVVEETEEVKAIQERKESPYAKTVITRTKWKWGILT